MNKTTKTPNHVQNFFLSATPQKVLTRPQKGISMPARILSWVYCRKGFHFLTLIALASVPYFSDARIRTAESQRRIQEEARRIEIELKRAGKERARDMLTNKLAELGALNQHNSRVLTTRLREALGKTLTFLEPSGEVVHVNLHDLGVMIEATRRWSETVNRSEMDSVEKARFDAVQDALPILVQSLSLAALTSAGDNQKVWYLAKQLSLFESILTRMEPEDVRSHALVLDVANQIAREKPNMAGDEAFVTAIQKIFGDDTQKILDKLMTCFRG